MSESTGASDESTRRTAAAFGVAMMLFVPTFFLAISPFLRTVRAIVWLVGEGLAMGTAMYFNRRARPYRVERVRAWNAAMGPHRMLNPRRYAEGGRVFIHWQNVSVIVAILWWLLGPPLFAIGS